MKCLSKERWMLEGNISINILTLKRLERRRSLIFLQDNRYKCIVDMSYKLIVMDNCWLEEINELGFFSLLISARRYDHSRWQFLKESNRSERTFIEDHPTRSRKKWMLQRFRTKASAIRVIVHPTGRDRLFGFSKRNRASKESYFFLFVWPLHANEFHLISQTTIVLPTITLSVRCASCDKSTLRL